MKRISMKLFFSVMWKGVCQVVEWLFGLFGYKKKGVFSEDVWRMFAAGAAVVTGIFAVTLVYALCEKVYDKYFLHQFCYDPDCPYSEFISKDIYYHDTEDGRSYVFNCRTGEKMLRHLEWIAKPTGEDSLVCFNIGDKRGYFNKNTGKVMIPARYGHAWVFSEGLASVEENGSIKFIDQTGRTVIDNVTAYVPYMDGLFFHEGYCLVNGKSPELCCLIDRSGRAVLPMEYSSIMPSDNHKLWKVIKGDEQGVYDKDMNLIIPLTDCSLNIYDDEISMTMPDHTMRKYDLEGNLIHDFYIVSVRDLKYEKNEIINRPPSTNVVDDEITEVVDNSYRPETIARLMVYIAGQGYEGLMSRDGLPVTMPIYEDIVAIGPDLYLCTVSNNDKVVVNGKGDVVK